MKQQEEIAALFDEWNRAIQSGDPDKVTELYAFNGILLPTVSNQVRHNHAEIRDYFVHFLAKKPKGEINESNIRIYNDIAFNSGVYTFSFTPDGEEPFAATARFTFAYRWQGDCWQIIEHHSSLMPEK